MTSEKIILGQNTGYPLRGLLTLPENTAQPLPAVVFVHGSGSSNMDEKVGKLTPFRDLADGLAQHGIASVRYDKRSFSHGMKMLRDPSSPITVRQETIEDAVLAAELLRSDTRIDPSRIFIIGHSMGAMLAPRIDAEGGDFAGFILMAGTLRKLEDVMLSQTAQALAELPAFPRMIAGKQVQKLTRLFDGLYDLPDAQAMKKKVGGGTTLYYFKEMGEHPAADYLKVSCKPMLIMQGERDVQVKADVDYRSYQELLGDRNNVTFRLYPGLNHAFVPAVTSSIAKARQEFAAERHIGADVIADIANWILSI